ncbi:MAG: response regulator transcription factor, partial [Actinobacteria bacterium]|nr:response regulator transcription factor [Actinomycetota bacterium]
MTTARDLKNPRVLVVEDDLPLRSALEVALEAQGFEVRAEADGTALSEVAATFRPDLAILDVRLQVGPNGFALARMLRRTSQLPLIFLTAADSVEARLSGFEAGADDYVVKPFSMGELLARVRALLRRSGRLVSDVLQAGDLVGDEGGRRVLRGDHVIELTRTEYELLVVLAHNFGKAVSKVQLLADVWGYDAYDKNLVEVHVSSLRRKLEAHGPRVVHT